MGKNFIELTDSQIIIALEDKEEKRYALPLEAVDSLAKIMAQDLVGIKELGLIFSQRGILYRIVKIPFMPVDDFEKMMEFEKGEYLSVDPEEYEIRYKIMEKYDENGQLFWDVALAGIKRGAFTRLVEILENLSIAIKFVDIIPAVYERVYSQIDEGDLMILEDDGQYSRICILKNKMVFMFAEFPLDNNELLLTEDYGKLLNEIRGYMDYFSSRNFGKNLGALLLLGNYDKEDIGNRIAENFSLNIYRPGDGSADYSYIPQPANDSLNFLPEDYALREKERKQKRTMKIALPLLLAVLLLPLALLFFTNQGHKSDLNRLQEENYQLENQIMMLEPAKRELHNIYEQIDAFEDLINNSYRRVANLRNIERYVPQRIIITDVLIFFPEDALAQDGEEEEAQYKIYERVPDRMHLEGRTSDLEAISKFVYKLNEDPLVQAVAVSNIGWLPEHKMNSFFITVEIKEDETE